MKPALTFSLCSVFALLLTLQPASSQAGSHDHSMHNMKQEMGKHSGHSMNHDHHHDMDHNAMSGSKAKQGKVMGILHNVDSKSGMVNVTHEAIPALGWPKMTMDLPVTKRVKLSQFSEGDKVHMTIKKGRDNKFRITKMMKAH